MKYIVDTGKLSHKGPHVLDIRVRAARHPSSTGNKVRFKQLLITDRGYTLHTIRYSYDALARLREARYAPGFNPNAADADLLRRYQYSFDLSGNRTQQIVTVAGSPTTTNYGYNAANQMTSAGAATLTYDDNGNLISDGMTAYTWDRANRMLGAGSVSYAYDGTGNRISQTVSATVTQYLLDLQPGLAVTLSQTTGANTDRYIHSLHGIHAQKDAGNNWEWMLQDGLGSVRGVADNTSAVLWSGSYDPFGTGFGATGTSQTSYGFTGEQYDPTTDLLYLRARHYKPGLGTFTGPDPFEGLAQRPMSLNEYSWVEGDPTNGIDPSGLYCQGNLNDAFGLLSCGISNLGELISDLATITTAAANNLPSAWNQTWNQTWHCGLTSFVQSHVQAANNVATWYQTVGNRQITYGFFPLIAGGFTVQDWLNGREFQPSDVLVLAPLGISLARLGANAAENAFFSLLEPVEYAVGDPLLDNNVLNWIDRGNSEAIAFAQRYQNNLTIDRTVVREFIYRNGSADPILREQLRGLIDEYGISVVPGATVSDAQNLLGRLNQNVARAHQVTTVNADLQIIATADMQGLRLATGDVQMLYRALRLGVDARYFNFSPSASSAQLTLVAIRIERALSLVSGQGSRYVQDWP